MEVLRDYPFNKLELPEDEVPIWHGSNPTFHRSSEYGILITDKALYLFRSMFLFWGTWKRYALINIQRAKYLDRQYFPTLIIETQHRDIRFKTPYDGYKDEMDFDRKKLKAASDIINQSICNDC